MSKFSDNFVKFIKSYIIAGIVALTLGGIIFVLYYFLKSRLLIDAVNGITIAFASLLAIAGFIWLSEMGSFDSLVYGFKQLFTTQFSKKANKYNDYAGYLQEKKAQRTHVAHIYYSFLFVAVLFGIALIVLEIVYNTSVLK